MEDRLKRSLVVPAVMVLRKLAEEPESLSIWTKSLPDQLNCVVREEDLTLLYHSSAVRVTNWLPE